jgi:hypothetical protein
LVGDYTPGAAGACGLFNLFGGTGRGVFRFSVGERDGSLSAPLASAGCDLGWREDPEAGVDVITAIDAGVTPASSIPLRARMIGSVDCATGRVTAEIKGAYRSASLCTLGVLENDYFFKGSLRAMFDPATRSFVGDFNLREPPAAIGPAPGGVATFSAVRVGPNSVLDVETTDCFGGLTFPDAMFNDAGM